MCSSDLFWYVPSVAGSPMDRKPEIDNYLMSGPFSWPSTVDLLSQAYVPVKQVPKGEIAKKYAIKSLVFLEPGWLVLDSDGNERARMSQITSFQPEWFEAPLRELAGLKPQPFAGSPALREAWDAYRACDADGTCQRVDAILAKNPAEGVVAEGMFLRGAALRRSGRTEESNAVWRALGERLPNSTWAWKAAMESEGHGPFVHGFEDFLPEIGRAHV